MLDFYSTNSLSWEQLDYGEQTLLNLHYGLIHVGLPTLVNLKKETLPGVKKGYVPSHYEPCKSGDVAFADASEDTNDVGKAIEFIDTDNKNVVCGLHTIHGRDNKGITVNGFKGYAFASIAFHHQIRRIAQGTKIFSISTKNFSECSIGIPSKIEQEKIAKLLSLVDERLITQSRAIEDLKRLRLAFQDKLIEQLVCSNNLKSFSEVYEVAGEGGTPDTSKREYYEGGTIPFIKIDDLANKYLKANKDSITELGMQKSSAWLVPANSLIFSNGATIGAASINSYPVATKQGILGIVPKNNISVEYLYYLMTSTYFKKQVHRIITHGTMATAYLKDINKISVPIPSFDKQEYVSLVLSSLSGKEAIETQMLSQLQNQKQYLLQRMFI